MTWITSIHYMMCPWIEDSKINLGSRAGRGGNIWAEMLKSITALFFYSLKTVMHTKPWMGHSDDPSSSSEVAGLFFRGRVSLYACINVERLCLSGQKSIRTLLWKQISTGRRKTSCFRRYFAIVWTLLALCLKWASRAICLAEKALGPIQ